MTDLEFIDLSKRVFKAEKKGFWSDWTKKQQELYLSGDWKSFSRSRGYTEEEIKDCQEYLNEINKDKNRLSLIKDLCIEKAISNFKLDTNNEILRTSHSPIAIKNFINKTEVAILNHPLHQGPKDFPLKHTFVNGMYIRESFMPAGYLFTTQTHKQDHPMFLMYGEASILSDKGFVKVVGPYNTITKAGTKRLVLTHTDTLCITVHKTDKTSISEAEEDIYYNNNNIKEENLLCQG